MNLNDIRWTCSGFILITGNPFAGERLMKSWSKLEMRKQTRRKKMFCFAQKGFSHLYVLVSCLIAIFCSLICANREDTLEEDPSLWGWRIHPPNQVRERQANEWYNECVYTMKWRCSVGGWMISKCYSDSRWKQLRRKETIFIRE